MGLELVPFSIHINFMDYRLRWIVKRKNRVPAPESNTAETRCRHGSSAVAINSDSGCTSVQLERLVEDCQPNRISESTASRSYSRTALAEVPVPVKLTFTGIESA